MRIVVLIVVLLGAGWQLAAPHLTINALRDAVSERDTEQLAELIDHPTLRRNLKDQINALVLGEGTAPDEESPLVALGLAIGGFIADRAVDALVTPGALARLMRGDSAILTELDADRPPRKPLEGATTHYSAWDRFVVDVPRADGPGATQFVLRRRGLGWQLTNIILPFGNNNRDTGGLQT